MLEMLAFLFLVTYQSYGCNGASSDPYAGTPGGSSDPYAGAPGAYHPARALLDPELAQIPDDILRCYSDRRLWDRFSRLPSSLASLTAAIRKVELHPKVRQWTPGRLAASLIHRFRFDGIVFDRCIDTRVGALPFRLDLQVEFPKMALVWQLVSGDRNEFPDDALTVEEQCALHWMLSYSVNTTFRSDEIFWAEDFPDSRGGSPYRDDVNYNHGGANAWLAPRSPYGGWADQRPPYGSKAFGGGQRTKVWRDCVDSQPKSRSPWELGVVWSPTGPLAAGPMLAGLAAGLQPQTVDWEAGRVDNGWAASLAGDIGQTALMKRKDQPLIGPDGFFNSTVCPAEFYLRSDPRYISSTGTFSHLTVAEINGGLDGLLMSSSALQWESKTDFTLSQIIDLYYSTEGLALKGSTPRLSACDRYANYKDLVSPSELSEQAFIFGVELRNVLVLPVDEDSLRTAVGLARRELDKEVAILDQTLNDFGPCAESRVRQQVQRKKHPSSSVYADLSSIDAQAESEGPVDAAFVLDTSVYSVEDQEYMKMVAAAVVNNADVWATLYKDDRGKDMLTNGGSIFELTDGRRGDVLVSSNQPYYFHDNGNNSSTSEGHDETMNKAELSCNMVRIPFPLVADPDPGEALERIAYRISARQDELVQLGDDDLVSGRALAIVLFSFGRVSSDDRQRLSDAVFRVRRYYPAVRLLVATRWAPPEEFEDLVLFPSHDIFVLQPYNDEPLAEADGFRIARRLAQVPGQVTYECVDPDRPEYSEARSEQTVYVRPDTQRFLEVRPEYFYRAKQGLEIFFNVEYNGAEICASRASPEERATGVSRWDVHKYYSSSYNRHHSRERGEDEFDPDEDCKTASNAGGRGGRVDFRWDEDPCKGQSLTRCRPIYFRLVGLDAGGTRCTTDQGYPCRTANTALIKITHKGMKCSGTVTVMEWRTLTLLVLLAIFYGRAKKLG